MDMNFNLASRHNLTRAFATTAAGFGILALAACGQVSGPAHNAANVQPNKPGSAVPANDSHVTNPGRYINGRCLTEQLRVRWAPTEGTAGHSISRLTFTNLGDHRCSLYGYPGLSYVAGDDGHQVGAPAIRAGGTKRTVWLAPGGHAYSYIQQVDIHNYSSADCDPTKVRGWRVYPPNETAAKYVPAPNTECANPHLGRPKISPVTADHNPYAPPQ